MRIGEDVAVGADNYAASRALSPESFFRQRLAVEAFEEFVTEESAEHVVLVRESPESTGGSDLFHRTDIHHRRPHRLGDILEHLRKISGAAEFLARRQGLPLLNRAAGPD